MKGGREGGGFGSLRVSFFFARCVYFVLQKYNSLAGGGGGGSEGGCCGSNVRRGNCCVVEAQRRAIAFLLVPSRVVAS